MTKPLLFLAAFLSSAPALAADEPAWFSRVPEGENYDYFRGVGDGVSEDKAYVMAVTLALTEIAREAAVLNIQTEVIAQAKEQMSDNAAERSNTESIDQRVRTQSTWQIAPGVRVVRTRLDRDGGRFRAYVLLEVPRREPRAEPKRSSALLWSLIPGGGQIWKHQYTKGCTILATEVVLVGGAITTGIMGQKARQDANGTSVPADRSFYSDRADTLYYVGLGLGITAFAVYVYNLVDAYVTERDDVIYKTARLSPTIGFAPNGAQALMRVTF